ncbi:MAG: hypothetical protein R3289_17900 [Photobacterium sp.]|nr:hypothetical protein [Photobacterium sp.]
MAKVISQCYRLCQFAGGIKRGDDVVRGNDHEGKDDMSDKKGCQMAA